MAEQGVVDSEAKAAGGGIRSGEAGHLESHRAVRRRSRAKWAAGFLLLAVAGGALLAWRHYAGRESTDDAQIDGHIHPISARVGGTVLKINVNDNQYVEAGTVLVEIDQRDYQVALEQARANLAAAGASLNGSRVQVPVTSASANNQLSGAEASVAASDAEITGTQRSVDAARSRLLSAQARLREAEAIYHKAASDVERLKPLIAKDEISQQQYDATVDDAKSKQAKVDVERAAISDAEQEIRVAESRVTQAEARKAQAQSAVGAAASAPQQIAVMRARAQSAEAILEQARAAVHEAELRLEYTTVKAPISGVVSKKNVELGQVIQPGQPLLAIVPLDDIWITANFKETQIRKVRPGQRVKISVDTFGGRDYEGHIDSIAPATGARFSLLPPENATGNYVKVVQRVPVKIVLEKDQNKDHLLRPGMSVDPTIFTRSGE